MFLFFYLFTIDLLTNTFSNQHDLERITRGKSNCQSGDLSSNPKSTTNSMDYELMNFSELCCTHTQNGDLHSLRGK